MVNPGDPPAGVDVLRVALHHPMRIWVDSMESLLQSRWDVELVAAHTSTSWVTHAVMTGRADLLVMYVSEAGNTLTETLAAWDAARAAGWRGIASARSGESEDVSIVHLAVGWGIPQLKVGSFARSERMAKWNEGLRIEEALGAGARLARPFAEGRH